MEDLLNDEEEEIQLSDKEIFTKIWTSPRLVFKFINNNNYDKFVIPFLFLSGISKAFDRASFNNMGDTRSLGAIIGTCIVSGAIFGWIFYAMYAALVSWIGKWLGGKADTKSILRILAYAMLPSVVLLIFLIPQILIYRNEFFKSESDISNTGLVAIILGYGFTFLELTLGIWTFVLSVIGISEVQKISIGRSILNLILPVIIIFLAILGLVLIYNVIR